MVRDGSKGNYSGSHYESLVEYDVMEIEEKDEIINCGALEGNG